MKSADITDENYRAMQDYLRRLGESEYRAHVAARKKNRNVGKFSPSAYMRSLVTLLGQNDEQGFKALKAEQGYASKVGS